MIIKKLSAFLLCLLMSVSSAMCVNAEGNGYNIFFFDNESDQWIYCVQQNYQSEEIEGMSWDGNTCTLTLDNFSKPAFKMQADGYYADGHRMNLVLKGENELSVLDLSCPVRISGEGTLNAGKIQAVSLEVNSGTLNLKSDYLKKSKDDQNRIADVIAIDCTAIAHVSDYAFLGGKINISGDYYGGITHSSANIEIAGTDIRIDLPKNGVQGISCGSHSFDGVVGGNLKIKDSSIYIQIKDSEYGNVVGCYSFEDVNHNLKYYTGNNGIQKKLTYEEVFNVSNEWFGQYLSRSPYYFPKQNTFFITNEGLFDDVVDSSKYYYDPVYWAFNHNPQITTGTSKTQFSPNKNVTRGQMVTFLYRLAGEPAFEGGKTFDDVGQSKYYAKAISWAASKGITTGYAGTNNFGPDDNCTREQIVTFLWRYAEMPSPKETAEFTDTKKDAYYLNALSWAKENNITVGLNDGTGRFGVGHTCTRGMCVTFLYRYDALE